MRRRIFAGELLFGIHRIQSAPGSNDAFASETHERVGLKGLLAAGQGALECTAGGGGVGTRNLTSVKPTTCVRAVLERNAWCLAIEPADTQTPQSGTSGAAFAQLFGISLANSTAAAATVATAATTATAAKAQHVTTPTPATTNPTTTAAPIACAGHWADNSGKVSGTTYTQPHNNHYVVCITTDSCKGYAFIPYQVHKHAPSPSHEVLSHPHRRM